MRLIDADELMEHVWRDKLDSRELIAAMIENAPTVRKIKPNPWISVANKLPEKGVNVLVTDGKYYMVTWCEFSYRGIPLWINNTTDFADEKWGDITHWCYLPEPPEKENKDVR